MESDVVKSGFDPGTVIFTMGMVHFIAFAKGYCSNTTDLIMLTNSLFACS